MNLCSHFEFQRVHIHICAWSRSVRHSPLYKHKRTLLGRLDLRQMSNQALWVSGVRFLMWVCVLEVGTSYEMGASEVRSRISRGSWTPCNYLTHTVTRPPRAYILHMRKTGWRTRWVCVNTYIRTPESIGQEYWFSRPEDGEGRTGGWSTSSWRTVSPSHPSWKMCTQTAWIERGVGNSFLPLLIICLSRSGVCLPALSSEIVHLECSPACLLPLVMMVGIELVVSVWVCIFTRSSRRSTFKGVFFLLPLAPQLYLGHLEKGWRWDDSKNEAQNLDLWTN